MVGSVASSSARSHGVDRFYNPPALRRQLQLLQQEQLQQQQQEQQQQLPIQQQQQQPQQQHQPSQTQQQQQQQQQPIHQQQQQPQQQHQPPPPQQQRPARPKTKVVAAAAQVEVREVEIRIDPDDSSSASPSLTPRPTPSTGNLDRFLESTTPVVPAQYFPKASMRGRRNGETMKFHPYFSLGDLWESFREWSTYGAGVPLTLNGGDSVVQYYVPYLSGIQLYADSSRQHLRYRHPVDESDLDMYRDASSGGSGECAVDRRSEHTCDVGGIWHITERMNGTLLGDKLKSGQESSSSEDGEVRNNPGPLVFEYLEREPPYGREPLADKIFLLSHRFPELKTYNSCDLLPSSWMSVSWYPIYRIPTGPTLQDLDACFLTFHPLSTNPKDINGHPDLGTWSIAKICNAMDTSTKLSLSIFGMASYKFGGSIWSPNGLEEQRRASSLLQDAESRLRLLKVDHPDFSFFLSHSGISKIAAKP